MTAQYFTVLTNYGTQAFAKALATNQPLRLSSFAVGDGNGQAVTPTADRTALVKETHRANVSAVSLDPRNNKQIIIELTIPEDVGGFYIREMGVFDSANKLVAYANAPESFKPTLESGSGKVQVLRMILKVSNSQAVTLSIDNSVIFVTRQQLTPQKITSSTTNSFDESGHTHEIEKADTTKAGIVRLTDDTGLDSDKLGLSARAGKKLAQLISTVQLALGNYIPNNKKSNSVTSNSNEDVATSLAVKTAYDKSIEANNNANGRVSKDGDEIKWLNVIRDHAWLGIKSTRYGSAGLDFSVQGSNYPQVSLEAFDVGGFGEELRIHTTPQGSNYDSDRRNHVMTVAHDGNVWVKPYGWLHDYFAKQADINNVWNELNNTYRKNRFGHRYYQNHYDGAEVYDIPIEDRAVLRITIMQATIDGSKTISLPERYTGLTKVVATDVGGGRHVVGLRVENWNSLVIENSGRTGLNIIVIGVYGW